MFYDFSRFISVYKSLFSVFLSLFLVTNLILWQFSLRNQKCNKYIVTRSPLTFAIWSFGRCFSLFIFTFVAFDWCWCCTNEKFVSEFALWCAFIRTFISDDHQHDYHHDNMGTKCEFYVQTYSMCRKKRNIQFHICSFTIRSSCILKSKPRQSQILLHTRHMCMRKSKKETSAKTMAHTHESVGWFNFVLWSLALALDNRNFTEEKQEISRVFHKRFS